jgi:hypothetical protein
MYIFEIYISFFRKIKINSFLGKIWCQRRLFLHGKQVKIFKKLVQLRKLRFWIIAFVIMTNLFNQAPTHSELSLKAHMGSWCDQTPHHSPLILPKNRTFCSIKLKASDSSNQLSDIYSKSGGGVVVPIRDFKGFQGVLLAWEAARVRERPPWAARAHPYFMENLGIWWPPILERYL